MGVGLWILLLSIKHLKLLISLKGLFTTGPTHLGFSEEELQVSAAQDAVVLDVAREVHGAGAVHGAMDLHVAVDGVKVLLFVLEQTRRQFVFLVFILH